MGSEGDRDYSVTFLQEVEISLEDDHKEWLLHDFPNFLFQDETGKFARLAVQFYLAYIISDFRFQIISGKSFRVKTTL